MNGLAIPYSYRKAFCAGSVMATDMLDGYVDLPVFLCCFSGHPSLCFLTLVRYFITVFGPRGRLYSSVSCIPDQLSSECYKES